MLDDARDLVRGRHAVTLASRIEVQISGAASRKRMPRLQPGKGSEPVDLRRSLLRFPVRVPRPPAQPLLALRVKRTNVYDKFADTISRLYKVLAGETSADEVKIDAHAPRRRGRVAPGSS